MTVILFALALLFAMNVGGSGTAASVGPSYGAKIVSRRGALFGVALAMFAGSVLGSGQVIETITKGIIPQEVISLPVAAVILVSAGGSLMTANLLGVPLSTSEVTVGALLGVGFAFGAWSKETVYFLALVWLAVPIVSFFLCWLVDRLAARPLSAHLKKSPARSGLRWTARLALVAGGLYQAFAAGMNNVANAVGPLVSAGVLSTSPAQWLGGIALASGAWLLGRRVLETSGKKITDLSLSKSAVVMVTSGTITLLASLAGLPVPMVQAVTAGTMGVGVSREGLRGLDARTVVRIIQVWLVSPTVSALAAYAFSAFFVGGVGVNPEGAVNMCLLVLLTVAGMAVVFAVTRRLRARERLSS